MPRYQFDCDDCGNSIEFYQSMHDTFPTKCFLCGSKSPAWHQNYTAATLIVYNSPTTFGQQAEINAKKMGKEQMDLTAKEFKKRKPFTGHLPEGARIMERPTENSLLDDKPLNLNKIKDVQKYIMTGETN